MDPQPSENGSKPFDEDFMQALYQAVRWAIRSRYHRHPHPDEVAEMSQQICLNLLRHECHGLHSFDPQKASLKTWLRSLAHNAVFQDWQRQKGELLLETGDPGSLVLRPTQEVAIFLWNASRCCQRWPSISLRANKRWPGSCWRLAATMWSKLG